LNHQQAGAWHDFLMPFGWVSMALEINTLLPAEEAVLWLKSLLFLRYSHHLYKSSHLYSLLSKNEN
jgi:hypothetical protein